MANKDILATYGIVGDFRKCFFAVIRVLTNVSVIYA